MGEAIKTLPAQKAATPGRLKAGGFPCTRRLRPALTGIEARGIAMVMA